MSQLHFKVVSIHPILRKKKKGGISLVLASLEKQKKKEKKNFETASNYPDKLFLFSFLGF